MYPKYLNPLPLMTADQLSFGSGIPQQPTYTTQPVQPLSFGTLGEPVSAPPVSVPQIAPVGTDPIEVLPDAKVDGTSEKPGWFESTMAIDGDWSNGLNLKSIGSVLSGLGSLGSLYAGIKTAKAAENDLAFRRESFNKNFANQLKTYNTNLEDRTYNRATMAGKSKRWAENYIKKNRLEG